MWPSQSIYDILTLDISHHRPKSIQIDHHINELKYHQMNHNINSFFTN